MSIRNATAQVVERPKTAVAAPQNTTQRIVDAMDAARSALYTSDTRLTARETARIARSAVMINYQIGHVLSQLPSAEAAAGTITDLYLPKR